MITYTYIVKCPECEDEFFDFFEEAKEFALGCMSKKPIITQTEVERNDFGECTDHCDLGTVWSWEDMMKETDAEPTISVFTKDNLTRMTNGEDPEFAAIDNSVDYAPETETSEVSNTEETPDDFRKPIPEGMSIKELVEAMEENEDHVECAGCEELFPKNDCTFNKEIGWLCPDCEDSVVKCTWCDELYDKSECRYEVDLGWLCDRCEAAIKSRGETLTFREGNYWDFLDEEVETKTWACYWDGVKIGAVEATDEDDANYQMQQKYPEYPYGLHKHDDIYWVEPEDRLNEASLSDIAAAANSEFGTSWDDDYILDTAGVDDDFRSIGSFGDSLPKKKKTRELSPEEIAEREAKAAEHERQKNMRFAQRYVAKYGAERYNTQYPVGRQNWGQEWPYYDEATGEFVEGELRDKLVKKFEDEQHAKRMAEYEERHNQPRWYIQTRYNGKWHNLMNTTATTKEDAERWALDYMKNLEAKRRTAGGRFDWKETDIRVVAGKGPGPGALQRFEEDIDPEVVHDLGNEYDGGYPAEKPELPEIDEVSDSHLTLCPECGKNTFDNETGICVGCGFN